MGISSWCKKQNIENYKTRPLLRVSIMLGRSRAWQELSLKHQSMERNKWIVVCLGRQHHISAKSHTLKIITRYDRQGQGIRNIKLGKLSGWQLEQYLEFNSLVS